LRIRTLPSREVVESLTLPEHRTKAPRGIWPSTKSTAPPGYVLRWLALLKDFNTGGEKQQNHLSLRNLQVRQLSMISNPYGVFMTHSLAKTRFAGLVRRPSHEAFFVCSGMRRPPRKPLDPPNAGHELVP